MHAVAPDITRWFDAGAPAIALATTLRTWGSAPLPVGSAMAIAPDGAFSGSVSGGCVEAAVIHAAVEMLAGDGAPRRMTFDVGDETAWSVGLACGGQLDVWLERWTSAAWQPVARALADAAPTTLTRIVGGPAALVGQRSLDGRVVADGRGDVSDPEGMGAAEVGYDVDVDSEADANADVDHDKDADADVDVDVASDAAMDAAMDADEGADVAIHSAASTPVERFTVTLAPRPHVVIVGAGEIAVALAKLAAAIDRPVTIVDPRRAFASQDRFPGVDAIRHDGPADALRAIAPSVTTAVVILSHDPKIDDPALTAALGSDAGYIGALGGRVSQVARRERLSAAGWGDADIARIHGPVGLSIGAKTPAEIAVSILAEIVATERSAGQGA
ncbi:MAG: XdhC/CoxI family protein [Ardenticatenales bacterium]